MAKRNKVNWWAIAILIFIIVDIFGIGYYLNERNKFSEIKCERNTMTLATWNNQTASQLGVTPEIMVNISYAYLFDYKIRCPDNIQDCFIDVPSRFCYLIDREGSYIYSREVPITKGEK